MTMDATVERNRAAYATLGAAFSQTGLGRQANFLNWGYEPVDGLENEACDPQDRTGGNAACERLVAELIGPMRLDGRRFVDIGCGRGGALDFMSRTHQPLSMTGIDLSVDNINSARMLLAGRRVRLQIADACALPLGDESQDVVLNLESSGAYPDMASFLRHVHRVLSPGGHFLHGDLWPKEFIEPFCQAMVAIGFVRETFRDVTAQVCRARERLPADLIDRLSHGGGSAMGDLHDYFAAPGSAMWDCLDRGRIVYLLTRWRKVESGPGSVDVETLNPRGKAIEACVKETRHSVAARARWFPFGAPRMATKVNILAFPHAVAGASAFKAWGQAFPPDWHFSPVQLPGRESRISEPPFTSLAQAVDEILGLIAPYASRPLALVGWSLGSKLAFELARQLEAEGVTTPLLVVAGVCPGPHQPLPDIASFFGGSDVEKRLRLLGGTPESILTNTEMLGALKTAIEGDIAMAAGYRSEAMICAPMLAISATRDDLVSEEAVESWRMRASGGFEHHRLEGGHFLARDEGERIAALVRDAIALRLAGKTEKGGE